MGDDSGGGENDDSGHWQEIWKCVTSTPTTFLAFSPDSTLFATAAGNDRLVKIWYDNKHSKYH